MNEELTWTAKHGSINFFFEKKHSSTFVINTAVVWFCKVIINFQEREINQATPLHQLHPPAKIQCYHLFLLSNSIVNWDGDPRENTTQ